MNKEYQHSEMIEAYLRNELSAAERADFEQLVRQDPLLYNEFLLQKEIVSGLQSYRKAQLKNRLNQVDVSNTSSWSGAGSATAWIGGLVLVGLLSWFGYSYLNNKAEDTVAVAENTTSVTANANTNTNEIPAADNSVESETAQKVESSVPAAAASETTVSAKPVKSVAKTSRVKSQSSGDALVHMTPANEMTAGLQEESLNKTEAEPVADKLPAYGNTAPAANRLNVIDNTNEKLKLHYYYRNGRIALLGFEKPYTFLDMPSENITYLHYEGNYYKLNVNQIQPAPIQNVLVTDQLLVDSLNKMLTERK